MNKQYEKTFKHFDFKNGVSIKNRVVMAPMTTWSSNDDYTVSEEEIKYYERRVTDIGLVITGCTPVRSNGFGFTNEFAAYNDHFIPSLTKLAKAAKSGGAKAVLQIFHAGNKSLPEIVGEENVVSASAIKTNAFENAGLPRALSEVEILEIIKEFGETTRRAILAGFDGVELHGAHGFLIQNFLSPYYNQRHDKWGGSLSNRMRFALSVVDEVSSVIKQYAKKPFILGYRFSPDEPEADGLRIKEIYSLIDELIKRDVDYIHASLPSALSSKPVDMQDGDKTYLDLLTIHINHKIPLIAAGSLAKPEDIELALEKGTDFAAVGHGLIINPDWMKQIKTDKVSAIETSISKSQVDELKLPKKLWQTLQNSGSWFNIVD